MLSVSRLQVFYGQSRVLNEVDLEVSPGQVVCLMGRNGVGKTTLLKAIMGILKARKGSILYDGVNLTQAPSYKRARAGIDYVPQGRGVFPHLTVYENLLMGLEALDSQGRKSGQETIEVVYKVFPVLDQMGKRVAGGDKIPRKGGPGITRSDLLLINKIDLAPYVGASLDVMKQDTLRMRGELPCVFTDLRGGTGTQSVVDWIEERLKNRIENPHRHEHDEEHEHHHHHDHH